MSELPSTTSGADAESPPPSGDRVAALLLRRSPLGALVRWVAGIRASVHTKLLGAFLLVVVLFFAMGGLSLETIVRMSRHVLKPKYLSLLIHSHGGLHEKSQRLAKHFPNS